MKSLHNKQMYLSAKKKRTWASKLKSIKQSKGKRSWLKKLTCVWQDLEFRGLTLEIMGLLMAFLVAGWQAMFTDWYDSYPTQSQAYSQEVANGATLNSLSQLAYALDTDNPQVKRKFLESINKVAGNAHLELDRISQQSRSVEETQANLANTIKLGLLFIGLIFILMGKYYVFRHTIKLRKNSHVHP